MARNASGIVPLQDFWLDAVEFIMESAYREWSGPYEPYLPKKYHVSDAIISRLKLGRVPKDEAREYVLRHIAAKYCAYFKGLREAISGIDGWFSRQKELSELMGEACRQHCERLEYRIRKWHGNVKELASGEYDLDGRMHEIRGRYSDMLKASLFAYRVSQDPEALDRIGIRLSGEFQIGRKIDKELRVQAGEQLKKSVAYIGRWLCRFSFWDAAADKNTWNFLRASIAHNGEKLSGVSSTPLELLSQELYPMSFLNPYRLRNKGVIFSEYLNLFEAGANGDFSKVLAFLPSAFPELNRILLENPIGMLADSFSAKYLGRHILKSLNGILAGEARRQNIEGILSPYNKAAFSLKAKPNGFSNIYNIYIKPAHQHVPLYILQADAECLSLLEKSFPNRILPEESIIPGVTVRELECSMDVAEKLCSKFQCISKAHMRSLSAIPIRDLVMQGIHTTFSPNELRRAFSWNAPESEFRIEKSVWDCAIHFGNEGALVFPYMHRIGGPGDFAAEYDASLEASLKGLPIVNVRKPSGADMLSGKYKKSAKPQEGFCMPKLPYFTFESLCPQFKAMSLRLLAFDYADARGLERRKAGAFADVLQKLDGLHCDLDERRRIIVIEGEKKTLALKSLNDAKYVAALDKYRESESMFVPDFHVSVGVGGVWFAKAQSSSLNEDLAKSVDFRGREAVLVFDKDAAEKEQVLQAFMRGARSIKHSGAASVKCGLMVGPNQADVSAKGLDDEISALIAKSGKFFLPTEISRGQMEAYSQYLPFFERSILPARTDISLENETSESRKAVASAISQAVKIGFDPEMGPKLLPESAKYRALCAIVPEAELVRHLESERQIHDKERSIECTHTR